MFGSVVKVRGSSPELSSATSPPPHIQLRHLIFSAASEPERSSTTSCCKHFELRHLFSKKYHYATSSTYRHCTGTKLLICSPPPSFFNLQLRIWWHKTVDLHPRPR